MQKSPKTDRKPAADTEATTTKTEPHKATRDPEKAKEERPAGRPPEGPQRAEKSKATQTTTRRDTGQHRATQSAKTAAQTTGPGPHAGTTGKGPPGPRKHRFFSKHHENIAKQNIRSTVPNFYRDFSRI